MKPAKSNSDTGTSLGEAAKAVHVLHEISQFERVGGRDSFWGRKQVFETCLQEEHEKDGLDNSAVHGAYRYKGLECYGNIVTEEPSRRACKRFLEEFHFRVEDLKELMKWYYRRKAQGSIDATILSLYLNTFIKGWKQEQREGKHE